jgi:hypothetical protein
MRIKFIDNKGSNFQVVNKKSAQEFDKGQGNEIEELNILQLQTVERMKEFVGETQWLCEDERKWKVFSNI